MWIKAHSGCLYVVVLGSKRALEPALFSAPIGVAVGGDSDQLTRGNNLQLSPRRCGDNSNTDIIANVQTPIIFARQNYLLFSSKNIFFAVVIIYEVKNWTPDLRTTIHFHRTRDDPPACPNAPGHPVAVEVVNFPYSLTIKYMATRLIPSLILDHHAETQLQILAFRAAIFYGLSPHTKEREATPCRT